jgi:hypothetical protein
MIPARTIQTSFTAGELDPNLYGRIEVSRYYSGAQRLENVLVRPQGGVRRRPGMAVIAELPAPAGLNGIRLIPFAFNIDQTYLIALTDGWFRVHRGSDGVILHAQSGCPWTGPQAEQINWAQSADTLLLFHPQIQPQQLRRGVDDTVWTRTPIAFSNIPSHDYGAGAEPVISATRGWPECGTFHQGRLYIGGFGSRPASFIGSKVGDFFNLDIGAALDDQAIYGTIQSDQVNPIHQMRSARTLQIFTGGAEYTPDVAPPYTPKNFSLIEQTRRGIQRFSPVTEVDGATMFTQRGGAALRQFLYSDTEAAFRSDLLSLLAPHLIAAPRELVARRGASTDDADHVLFTNRSGALDGVVTVLTTLRAQEIVAFTRWVTDGTVRGLAALDSGQVYFAVIRQRPAGPAMVIERWEEGRLLDSSARVQNPAGFTVVTGLSHLNGRLVQMVADGAFLGTATVAGGQVTLPRTAYDAEVGLGFTVRGETMPIEPRDPSGSLLGRQARVTSITARVIGTGLFEVDGRQVVLRLVGSDPASPLDTPPPLFTGDIRLRGMVGWSKRRSVTFGQTIPQPFQLQALAYDLRIGE